MARRKTRVSLQDIATELGISRNAAALALAGKPGISTQLRQLVGESATRLGYQSPSRSPPIGAGNFLVLVPEFLAGENPFYAQIFNGIELGLRSAGQHLMYATVPPTHYQFGLMPAICRSIDFRGILLIGAMPRAYVKRIAAMGLPTVLVDNNDAEEAHHAVGIANSHGLNLVTRHLIENGHRDIGFLGPCQLTQGFMDRYAGYRQALEKAGLPCDPALTVTSPWHIDSMHDLKLMRQALDQLPRLPQALVCLTDMIALSAMTILQERGKRIPEDISLVGFDDIQSAHLASPPLTTYRAPRRELGQEAARYICQLASQPGLPPVQRILYGSLQARSTISSRAP